MTPDERKAARDVPQETPKSQAMTKSSDEPGTLDEVATEALHRTGAQAVFLLVLSGPTQGCSMAVRSGPLDREVRRCVAVTLKRAAAAIEQELREESD